MEFLQDILAAIGVVLNGIPQGLLALSMGFASVPTALGFGVGVIGCLLLGSVAPRRSCWRARWAKTCASAFRWYSSQA